MKKFLLITFGMFLCSAAIADTPWWLQPTICRVNPSKCYASMGTGYDADIWDTAAGCRGMKMICARALTGTFALPQPTPKTAIASGTGISTDFDTNIIGNGGDCFGARKTSSNGTQALLDGQLVRVWCRNILDNPDEELATGEITYGAEPTCEDLAANGYAAIVNQNCHGKYFDPAQYFIECTAGQLLPTRIVALNGAEPYVGLVASPLSYPTDISAANALFQQLQNEATGRRKSHFGL